MIDYLFIGAQKTGSNSFIGYMNEHPDIYCCKKEIHYFDIKYNKKDFNWYEKHFKTKKTIVGEKSPSYLLDKRAINRIYNYNPNIKLIIFLREPIQRAYSHFNMKYPIVKERGNINKIFNEDINQQKDIPLDKYIENISQKSTAFIHRGFYYEQIKYIYSLFPKENVLILISDENKKDILKCYNKIFTFLGVKKLSNIKNNNRHAGTYPEELDMTNKKLLYKIYKPHNEKLYNLLGRKVDLWEEYYNEFINL
tara:strand:+ start:47 stop:802 length:756 start_codon:yes stop_codon:yes gene_type:complete